MRNTLRVGSLVKRHSNDDRTIWPSERIEMLWLADTCLIMLDKGKRQEL